MWIIRYHYAFLLLSSVSIACGEKNRKPYPANALFKQYCSNCHGLDGNLAINGAVKLQFSSLSLEERKLVISQGRNAMTGFSKILSPEEIDSIANYTLTFKTR